MKNVKTTFALFFGNRGFFPASLIHSARIELSKTMQDLGHQVIMLPEEATRFGAVETPEEGEIYARFLREQRGNFGGVILCLPNFGDENGAVAALKEAGVPILIQAYPDDLDRMSPELRRDAFCGKLSILDVFRQNEIKFTALKPHVVSPGSERFAENIETFDRICRVVGGLQGLVVGAIGARTTAFKTVRIDETALQRHGITVETLDLSEIFARVSKVSSGDKRYKAKAEVLQAIASWQDVPGNALENIVRLGVVLDEIIAEYRMDAVSVRCWLEMQRQLGISPCVLLGELNERGIPTACEVDVGSAVAMSALHLASGNVPACLDWNNNYGDEDNKCILFHCGPVPKSLMAEPGRITDHAILENETGKGCGYGCNQGRIAPVDFTFANLITDSGRLKLYLGQGRFTGEPIPADFFGCAGVAEIKNLQDVLLHIGREGHRHHVGVTPGLFGEPLKDALAYYLGWEVALPQGEVEGE